MEVVNSRANEVSISRTYSEHFRDAVARQILDRFLLLRPLAHCGGLFRKESNYYIVSHSAESDDEDGTLKHWFNDKIRVVTVPIELVLQQPEESVQLPYRTPKEILLEFGASRNWSRLTEDLAYRLPASFPLKGVTNQNRIATILVTRQLDEQETASIDLAFRSMGSVLEFQVTVDEKPAVNARTPKTGTEALTIQPAMFIANVFGNDLKRLVAQDHDYWRNILNDENWVTSPDTPSKLISQQETSCLVNTVFPPANIRSYLSIYSTVILVAPVREKLESTLQALCITEKDLKSLARLKSVHILLPLSVDRYDHKWLSSLAEESPDSLLFSRKLATLAARDQYSRNPLFSLPAPALLKREILRFLMSDRFSGNDGTAIVARCLGRSLCQHWDAAEYMLNRRGAMSTITSGLTRFAAELHKERSGDNLLLELGAAATNVEWAAALGAHVVSEEMGDYSSENANKFLIALASGFNKTTQPSADVRQFQLAEELLAFNNNTDVTEFVTELGKGDLQRFRHLLSEITSHSRSKDETSEQISEWNKAVRKYERKPDRLRSFGIATAVMGATGVATKSLTDWEVIPYVMPFIPMVVAMTTEDLSQNHSTVGLLVDWLNAKLSGASTTKAPLLSRLRKRVAGMKSK